MKEFEVFCYDEYNRIFLDEYENSSSKKDDEKRRNSQREAIKSTAINAIKKHPGIEPSTIWKTIYAAHVNNISGIVDQNTIKKVISADNSWKKSSGHAFEEMIRDISNIYLEEHGIKMFLQKELNVELHNNNILNEVRDLSWLRE